MVFRGEPVSKGFSVAKGSIDDQCLESEDSLTSSTRLSKNSVNTLLSESDRRSELGPEDEDVGVLENIPNIFL